MPCSTSINFGAMYVFDKVLEPKTSLLGDARLQRLIFRLPHEVMATARRDRRRLLKTPERSESSRPPWDAQGKVCFSYSGKTGTRLQVLKVQVLHLDAPHQGGLASPHSIQTVTLQLPLDLMQDVERLAQCEDWSSQAWLRNAIEAQVRDTRARLGLDESAS